MKQLGTYLFILFILGCSPYLLAQNGDGNHEVEVIEEMDEPALDEESINNLSLEDDDEISEDDDEQEQQEPTPWEKNKEDSYLNENLNRQSSANQTWEKHRKKLKYSQEEIKEPKKPRDTGDGGNLNSFTGKGFGETLRWIFIVIGIIVLLALIVYLAQGGNFRQGKKINVDISEEQINWIEENLPEANVQSPLDAAITSKQYRKAVRLYFLLLIQKMTLSGEINWQKEKTNRAYILETYHKGFHDQFRTTVRIYERVWYGERAVSEEEFHNIEPVFRDLINNFIIQTSDKHEE